MPVNLEDLGLAVKRAQHRDHRAVDGALKSLGISLVQWDALRAIDRAPAASSHELALATFQSDQSFGTLATRLVAAGWVERRPGGGRRLDHHLTDEGRRMLAVGHSVAGDMLQQLFEPLDERERADLARLLAKLLG